MPLSPPGIRQLSQAVTYPTRLRWGQALDIFRTKRQKIKAKSNSESLGNLTVWNDTAFWDDRDVW